MVLLILKILALSEEENILEGTDIKIILQKLILFFFSTLVLEDVFYTEAFQIICHNYWLSNCQ